jgi:glycosyltransferase involved in cell wall biosynthesis
MQPLISIIIPTYKRSDTLPRAIDSALRQTYSNIEIIVVDDNGEGTKYQKATEQKLKGYIESDKITYIKHKVNKNGSAARNTGFRASKGEYINFLDDDDELLPNKIMFEFQELQKHDNKFGACYCNAHIIGMKRNFYTHDSIEGNLIEEILSGKIDFNTTSILFCRDALSDIHGFDESFWRHQDWELYIRFFRKYKMCVAKEKYLMVKYATPNIITRNPQNIIKYKEYFLYRYKTDIRKMHKEKDIYQFQYISTALTLLTQGLKKEGLIYFGKSLHYGFPSFWDIIKTFYYSIR